MSKHSDPVSGKELVENFLKKMEESSHQKEMEKIGKSISRLMRKEPACPLCIKDKPKGNVDMYSIKCPKCIAKEK